MVADGLVLDAVLMMRARTGASHNTGSATRRTVASWPHAVACRLPAFRCGDRCGRRLQRGRPRGLRGRRAADTSSGRGCQRNALSGWWRRRAGDRRHVGTGLQVAVQLRICGAPTAEGWRARVSASDDAVQVVMIPPAQLREQPPVCAGSTIQSIHEVRLRDAVGGRTVQASIEESAP
jgi:hypothetical protein